MYFNLKAWKFNKNSKLFIKVNKALSKKYSTSRTQFVIFVTPEVIESAANGATDIDRKFRKRSR